MHDIGTDNRVGLLGLIKRQNNHFSYCLQNFWSSKGLNNRNGESANGSRRRFSGQRCSRAFLDVDATRSYGAENGVLGMYDYYI